MNVVARTYLNKPGSNSSKTALTAQIFFFRFSDDGLCMLGLGGCETGQVSTAATTAAAATAAAAAFLGDIATAPGSDIVVGNIAAVGGLVPDFVAVHGSASSLAGNCNIGSLLVALDDRVRGPWTRAAVDDIAGDGIGIDDWRDGGKCECQNRSEHHFEWIEVYCEVEAGTAEWILQSS